MKTIMTPEEFAAEMEKISYEDYTEERHIHANSLMCSMLEAFGYSKGIEIFRNIDKRYC